MVEESEEETEEEFEIIIESEEEVEEEEEPEEYKIYVVKVPPGREVPLIFLIKHRAELLGLPILSVFKSRSQDGVVFVEAANYQAVTDAIREFRYAYAFKDPLKFEEVKKYLDEFLYSEKYAEEAAEVTIEPGMLVEIIDGPFKGHKARVVSVSKKKVWVDLMAGGAMLVPVRLEDVRPITRERR